MQMRDYIGVHAVCNDLAQDFQQVRRGDDQAGIGGRFFVAVICHAITQNRFGKRNFPLHADISNLHHCAFGGNDSAVSL